MARQFLGGCAALTILACGCGGGGGFPLELEVKDGAALAGKRADELELVVKTIPGADLKFEDQRKSVGDKAIESFTINKSALKLGKNVFSVEATRGVLFSKEQTKATVTWDAPAKAFLRFHPSGDDGAGGTLTCGGAMCGGTTFKVGKDGKLRLEAESALAGWLSVAGRRESVAPRQRKPFEVDVTAMVASISLAQRDALNIPLVFEVGSEKVNEVLTLQGGAVSQVLAAALDAATKGPVTFPGEGPAPAEPRAVAVVGLPSNKLLVVGKAAKVEELDLVASAKTAERFFTCSGSGSTASGILYLDQELTVVERRTGKVVHTRKLMADRVACPTAEARSPLPGAAASRQVKAEVREADISKAVSELLTAGTNGLRSAAQPKK